MMKLMVLFGILYIAATISASPLSHPSFNGIGKGRKEVVTQGGEDPDPEIRARRDFVRQMMKDAWDDYVKWAWGENELKPVSQTGQSGGIFGPTSIGASIVDSLDTLYIMELTDEFAAARNFVDKELNFTVNASVSVFETNIRFVGGFLTAFALTQDDLFKDRAEEIGRKLLPAFEKSPTGIPYGWVNVLTGEVDQRNAVLAEFGTLHLEFMYLSEITGDPIFREKVLAIREFLKEIEKPNGLYPNHLDVIDGAWTDGHVSIGALGDSFYEYLLKAAIQLNDQEARQMYDEAMDGIVNNSMVKVSRQNHLLYIAELNSGSTQDVVGHLACFAGGMFALGAHVDPNNTNSERDAEIGRNFTNTCHESYIRTKTQIGPEIFRFSESLEAEAGSDGDRPYILRPEVIESYYVMYRITGDFKYREWAWAAAQAIQKYSKAGPGRGYSGLRNTNSDNPVQDDVQQTFFLAETLKYLYLIFSSNDLIALDQWVMNTECHPLPIKSSNPLY